MKIYHGLKDLGSDLGRVVMTIGNFDGLHLGHQKLIAELLDRSRQLNAKAIVVTFDPHPSEVLNHRSPIKRIYPQSELETQLAKLGVSSLIVEPFTKELSSMTGDAFFRQIILPKLDPVAIVVGHDFLFGHKKSGTFELLQLLGREFQFQVDRVEAVVKQNLVVSSTLIRRLLEAGEVDKAAIFLGRPYHFQAKVIKGEGRGEKMGIPTANMATPKEILPGEGVYLTEFLIDGMQYPSLTNIGHKPTFHKDFELGVETFVIGLKESTMGKSATVTFHRRLRDEIRFPNKEALIAQINEDIATAKRYFKL